MIVKISKKIVSQLISIIRQLYWIYQYSTLKLEKSCFKAEVLDLNKYKKIIIIIPHADDELIGCYNIIKHSKEQVLGYYLSFNGSNIRKGELECVANALDLKLAISNGDRNNELAHILMDEEPALICIPNFIDWHVEHIQANRILLNALEKLKGNSEKINILAYQVSVPFLEKDITHFCPMSKISQKDKWRLFKVYKSQKNIPVLRFKLNERLSGKLISNYSAEVYKVFNYNEYKKEFRKWERIDRNELKSNINNIINIRKTVSEIYSRERF